MGLMVIGILIGPVFRIIDPASFGQFGPLFSHLVLIFILFESGTDLKFSEVKSSFRQSAGITTLGFFTTWLVSFLICWFVLDLSVLTCLFIGATIGGTSSAVVVGLVKKIAVQPRTKTSLIMESAETDVFTLAIPIAILGIMITGYVEPHRVMIDFVSSIILALFIGITGAFLWSFIVNKIPTLKGTRFSTPAFLFILYGATEYLGFSGPLTALSFGIAIGNLQYLEPKILERVFPNQSIVLPQEEKYFFSEIVFLLRTFFFVFVGVNIQIGRSDWLFWGAMITIVLLVVRIVVIKWIVKKDTPLLDKSVMSFMIPKGLGAAVIATLPLYEGHQDGHIIQSIAFSVILFSTLFCVALFFLLQKGITIPLYRFIFGRDAHIEQADEGKIIDESQTSQP